VQGRTWRTGYGPGAWVRHVRAPSGARRPAVG
jgi:hypothetical protein